MAIALDPDPLQSASHRNAFDHLSGPFAGGAVDRRVAVQADATVKVAFDTRHPLVVVAPLQALDANGLIVTATLDGQNAPLPAVRFARYTEPGASLPLHLPATNANGKAIPFGFSLRVQMEGAAQPVAAADVAGLVEVRIIEGNIGQLLYVLGAEKQRIRREARQIAHMRLLDHAHDDALDRYGADLGVPRFTDRIQFDPAKKEIVTAITKDSDGNPAAESDDAYRRRLSLYRPFLVPNPTNVRRLLNGPGTDADPNRGPLAGLGLASRLRLLETPNQFAVAIKLVGTDAARKNFLDYVRAVHLIFPSAAAGPEAVHAARFLPSTTRSEIDALRTGLRAAFTFGDDMAIAPALAFALQRLSRCMKALGFAGPVPVLRAQDATAGSRYELGLGVDIPPLAAADLTAMIAARQDPQRARGDAGTEALIAEMTPAPPADDPEGAWLLKGCGLRTVHRVDTTRVYLSHLTTSGLVVEAKPPAANQVVPLEARYEAPGDPGKNAALAASLAAALPAWQAAGGTPWTVLTDAVAQTRWQAAVPQVTQPPLTVFQAAGLPAVRRPADVVPQLLQVPSELVETLRLDGNLGQQILAGQPAATDALRRLVTILRDHGIASVLPLVTTANEVLMVTAAIGLPAAGVNLSQRRATGFRWYVVPIAPEKDNTARLRTVGSRNVFEPGTSQLAAVVTIGYVRGALPDPFEVRVEAPDGVLLSLPQYEFLMNLLDHVYPVGVEINTFSLRQQHVDLDGDGAAEPLPPSISRTFRRFRRDRQRGESAVLLG